MCIKNNRWHLIACLDAWVYLKIVKKNILLLMIRNDPGLRAVFANQCFFQAIHVLKQMPCII